MGGKVLLTKQSFWAKSVSVQKLRSELCSWTLIVIVISTYIYIYFFFKKQVIDRVESGQRLTLTLFRLSDTNRWLLSPFTHTRLFAIYIWKMVCLQPLWLDSVWKALHLKLLGDILFTEINLKTIIIFHQNQATVLALLSHYCSTVGWIASHTDICFMTRHFVKVK